MKNRLRVLQGANALLYFGPLLAGLGGFGWGMVPGFAVIFMLWLVVIRPQDFPRELGDWLRPEALLAIASRAAVQVLLVLVCFGIGRGLGGVVGALPPFPMLLPLSISLLSVPLARLIWDPWQVQAMDQLLDNALAQIESGTTAEVPGGERAYAEAVTAPLNGLADDVSEAELEKHLSALRALVDEGVTFDVLLARVEAGSASIAGKRALMLMASDTGMVERMAKLEVPRRVMQSLDQDSALIGRMADRLVHALRQDQDIWPDCPTITYLERVRDRLPEAADAIGRLQAEILEQAPRD